MLKTQRRGKGLGNLLLLLSLLASSSIWTPRPAVAQAANTGAEVLTYGVDQLPDRVRDFHLRSVAGGDDVTLTHLGNAWYQNWSPDGKKIAIVTEALVLYTMNPDGSELTPLAYGVYSNPFWSPDSRFIAFLSGERWGETPLPRGNLHIISAIGGAIWNVPGATDIPLLPAGVAWSPDGLKIAAGWPGHIYDLTRADAPASPLPGAGADMWVLGGGWSPDGRYMAVTDGNKGGILELATGTFVDFVTAKGAKGANKPGASWAAGPRKVVYSMSTVEEGQRVFVADFDGHNAKLIWSVPYVANPRHGEISSIGPPSVDPAGQQALIRVSHTTAQGANLIFTHETWLLRLDGSENKVFIPFSFNAAWKPAPAKIATATWPFYFLWRRTDLPVANGQVARTWLWGPQPIAASQEPWAEAPGGQRLVEYYDKGRMEITDPGDPRPDPFYVTSGLLVKEMVTGQIATGATSVDNRGPADIPVAGDAKEQGAPTYVTFHALNAGTDAGRAPDLTGQHIAVTLDRAGTLGSDAGLGDGVTYAHFVPDSGHNIADAFYTWLQAQGDWVGLTGLPISEPYWVHATVSGQSTAILVQLFERRTLTFTPTNDPAWRVELGNVGQQYKSWRYGP
jgi:hypothetical protein